MDAVLLSGFASVKEGEKAIDLGTGTGIIPLLLSAKTDGDHFTGLEIQSDMAEMASRSVEMNDLLTNPDSAKAIARHEVKCTLDDIVRETASLLVPHGRCYFVHRPFRLVDLFTSMRNYGVEPKRMRLVYPYADREPNMVLVEGARGGNPRLTVEKPLVVYKSDGSYTDEIVNIYSF